MITLRALNDTSTHEFILIMSEIFENSPWIAAKAAMKKPFSSVDALYQSMVHTVQSASIDEKLSLIRAHPNLGERVEMSKNSKSEQQRAGLKDLTEEEYKNFLSLNNKYMMKFGFPFIMAVTGKNTSEIYQEMQTRVNNSETVEFEKALSEINKIALIRLREKII